MMQSQITPGPTCPRTHRSIRTWRRRRIMNVKLAPPSLYCRSSRFSVLRALVIYAFARAAEMQQACHAARLPVRFRRPSAPTNWCNNVAWQAERCYFRSHGLYICIYTRRLFGSSVSTHSLGEIIACVLGIANLHDVALSHSFCFCKQTSVNIGALINSHIRDFSAKIKY